MKTITVSELIKLINNIDANFQIIDVRSKEEWDEDHIQDYRVINIEAGRLVLDLGQVSKSSPVYLICESGGRSSYAQMILKTKGIESINVLGGMSSFRKN
jgi:rhodanese-related sulfurtransferase